MADLADRTCEPCRGDADALDEEKARALLDELDGWRLVDGHHLAKRWTTDDFVSAMALARAFGEVSEEQGHHPVLELSWGWTEARIFTHAIDGLTESDFVLAAKLDRAAAERDAEATAPGGDDDD